MLEYALLENIVGNWLWTVAKELLVRAPRNRWPDFELRGQNGERILIELKTKPPSDAVLERMVERLRTGFDASDQFLLVTPVGPTSSELERFARVFKSAPGKTQWVALDDFPALIGKPSPGPWNSPQTWSTLQTNALLKGLQAYGSAPSGPAPYAAQIPATELEALTRQFPYEVIAGLRDSPGTLESKLGFGARRDNVTIVLSDIVNFSSLVTASRPDDLKEAMGQYYQRARQAVFDHGGMLDKFIGDAVLAVFGYPLPSQDAPCQAIRFAHALTAIGQSVMVDWQAELNAVIETGTRIGIATGDIWPINIGGAGIEVTLLGDTINLAARLEKNCAVDKLLLGNRTYTAAQRVDEAFVKGLGLQQIIIPSADAKGQAFPIRAWSPP